MARTHKVLGLGPRFYAEHGPISATELGIKAGRYSLDENGEWQWSDPDKQLRNSLLEMGKVQEMGDE